MKKVFAFIFFLTVMFPFFSQDHPFFQYEKLEQPLCAVSADHEIRHFTHYSLCYREFYEQCEWAAYELTKEELEKRVSRTNTFKSDPLISSGSASLEDYRGSGYDRGHIAPAADFMFTLDAMKDTFYMSNMSPQNSSMNRGIWSRLEEEGRRWAENYGTVYIVTGPVLEKTDYKTIGINEVSVPEFFYKIFLSPVVLEDGTSAAVCCAYCIPNSKTDKPFSDFTCTINDIEIRTGIDFFFKLDDELEEKIEGALHSLIPIQ